MTINSTKRVTVEQKFSFLKLRGALAAFLLLLVLGGCKNTGQSADARNDRNPENVLRYDVNFPIGSFYPPEALSNGASRAFPFLYSYLFVPNSEGKLCPDVAERWTYDPENYTFTIRLRKDVRFHNGWPVIAKDIIYSWKLFTSVFSSFSSIVKSIGVLTEKEIVLCLTEDAPDFLDRIWDMEILPFPKKDKVDYSNHPVGSGPFQFVSRNAEKEVLLKANSSYFGGCPKIDRVIFKYIPDKERSWTRLLAGETDIVQEIAPKNLEIMKNLRHKFYISKYTLPYYTILLFNTRDPLFSNVKVRRAIAHSIDRDYIVHHILHGFGKKAIGPLGIDASSRNPDVHSPEYDPHKGLRLFAEANWLPDYKGGFLKRQDQVFEFTLMLSNESQVQQRVARYIQLCLNELGVKTHLISLPYDELLSTYQRKSCFQAVLTELQSSHRNIEVIQYQWCSDCNKRSIAGGFFDPRVSSFCQQLLIENNPKKRRNIINRLDEAIIFLQPGVYLYHKTAIDVMSRRIRFHTPFFLDHQGIHRLKHAVIE